MALGTAPQISHQKPFEPAQYDCETAMLMRAVILPLFDHAISWSALVDALRGKGYGLAFRGGALCLTDQDTDTRVCGLRFLGLDMRDLVARLGRPFVVVNPGSTADGELLRHPPARITLH
ncbi:MAG: hypothetical protein GJ676_06730 [Rhodobacteraceae bacterium]|nr:hypothetical protein [Paracoccaceae bacterium]